MKQLPKEQVIIRPSHDGIHAVASLFEHPEGYRYWDIYLIEDLK